MSAPTIVSFDSETYKGYPLLICASTPENSLGELIHDDLSLLSTEECLNWLIQIRQKLSGHVMGFFFNISFDTNAMLKEHFVDVAVSKQDRKEFQESHKLEIGKIKLFYIPNKALSINDSKRYLTCFDVSSFTRDNEGALSLQGAAQLFLGLSKSKGFSDKNRAKLNVDKKFWESNRNEITEYCMNDAKLTAALGQMIIQSIHDEYGFWLTHLYSSASIIKMFFNQHYSWLKGQFIRGMKNEPGWFSPLGLDEQQMKIISHSYYGGMFDTWRFGRIRHVKKRDIVSAYPFFISQLPRLDLCSISKEGLYHRDAVTGFYKISMKYIAEIPMPFRYGMRVVFPVMEELVIREDKNIYPTSDDTRIQYVTKPILDYLLEKKCDLKILDSIEFLGKSIPAFPEYAELFKQRKKYKEKRDSCQLNSSEWRFWNIKQWTAKIAMNAGYGVLAEKSHGATEYTNLAYASLITSQCRLMVLKAITAVGLKNVVSIATDSIQFTGSNNLSPVGSDLGMWENISDDCEIVSYQNGIQLTREKGKDWSMKARGVPEKSLKPKDFLTAKGSILKYEMVRPIRLLQALIINKDPYTVKNINIFKTIKRSIDLTDNMLKRDVDTYCFDDYNRIEVESRPLDLVMFEILQGRDLKHFYIDIPKVRTW